MNTKRPFRLIPWEKFGALKTSKYKGQEWNKYWIEIFGFKLSHIHSSYLKTDKHIHKYMHIYPNPGQLFLQFETWATIQNKLDKIESGRTVRIKTTFNADDYRDLMDLLYKCHQEHRIITPDEFEPYSNKLLLDILAL